MIDSEAAILETQMYLSAKLEAELRAAITAKLGSDDWLIAEIAQRIQVARFKGIPMDFYYLDGAVLLEVGDLKFECGKATRSIKRL